MEVLLGWIRVPEGVVTQKFPGGFSSETFAYRCLFGWFQWLQALIAVSSELFRRRISRWCRAGSYMRVKELAVGVAASECWPLWRWQFARAKVMRLLIDRPDVYLDVDGPIPVREVAGGPAEVNMCREGVSRPEIAG